LAEELTGMVMFVDLIAMYENIDLDEAVFKNFNATSKIYGLQIRIRE